MSLRVLTAAVLCGLVALALPSPAIAEQAQTQTPPPPKPDPKPEAKPDPKAEAKPEAKVTTAALAGKWDVNIETPQGAMQSALVLKADPKDAKKVTGTITSQMGEAAVEGELADGALTFWIQMNANGTAMSLTFAGKVQKDGSLAGSLDFGQRQLTWTATRAKN